MDRLQLLAAYLLDQEKMSVFRCLEESMETLNRPVLGVALPPDAAALQDHLPDNRPLKNLAVTEALALMEEAAQGGLAFVAASTWRELDEGVRARLTANEPWQFLLIADQPGQEALEFMASGAFLTLVTCPLDGAKVARALQQAEEVSSMYQDIFMMAREISLERELLARKNEQLAFLNQVLTRASQTLDPAVILSNSADDLGLLLDVRSVFGAFWNAAEGQTEAELFLPENLPQARQEDWINHLLSVAARLSRDVIRGYQVSFLTHRQGIEDDAPELEQLVTLPLNVGPEPFGALVISSREASALGQDRLRILTAAANHLALAMRNSLEFRKTKARADHDGLTRISNRHHFDMRLREEMKRHQRHQDELSLMMIDLDYFKSVNDTYGHQAGDMVLKEVGRILQKTLRESDFPARYGGEEFVVILPQTREEQAWVLAERLRDVIGQTVFRVQRKRFRVTASIGIAGVKPGSLAKPESLIFKADQALYLAKASGRNMVCCSAIEETSMAH
jgi:diguanylate cyclase (GGDEF)-like protein